MEIIFEFLGVGRAQRGRRTPPTRTNMAPGAFRTILFSDIENSSAITQRLGDVRARELLRAHETIVRDALQRVRRRRGEDDGRRLHGLVQLGDERRAVCDRNSAAVEAMPNSSATATHRSPTISLRVRIGLNAGEPIEEHDDLFGTSVNLAARIAAKAHGGEILASDVVRQLVAGKGLLFADRGDTVLRGFEDPVRLYEVRWQE